MAHPFTVPRGILVGITGVAGLCSLIFTTRWSRCEGPISNSPTCAKPKVVFLRKIPQQLPSSDSPHLHRTTETWRALQVGRKLSTFRFEDSILSFSVPKCSTWNSFCLAKFPFVHADSLSLHLSLRNPVGYLRNYKMAAMVDSALAPTYEKTSSIPTPPSTPPKELEYCLSDDQPCTSSRDFLRWRPSYHLMAPSGWLNDPCAPGFDPETGVYYLSFQWNPKGNDWGDISWGQATSRDLLSWDVSSKPSMVPDMPYDNCGIFTGCLVKAKRAMGRSGHLTCIYTSVNALPIHHTLDYTHGSESLSLAHSYDNGQTWEKSVQNPIIPSAPPELAVTGWRDPFVSSWPSMSRLLGHDPAQTLYGVISGGIKDTTPTTFVYAVDASDLSKWSYLGPLVNLGPNLRPSRWSGDLGRNWEVTNFLTMCDEEDGNISRDFLIMGTEGCLPSAESSAPSTPDALTRIPRCQLWMCGTLQKKVKTDQSSAVAPNMSYKSGGHLDHGSYYAANSFFDPATQRQTVWGWITEDDLCDELRHHQGWSGLLSLPRELRLQTIHHVTRAWSSELSSITSIEADPDDQGTHTVRTLASSPVQRVVHQLRNAAEVRKSELRNLQLKPWAHHATFGTSELKSVQWELNCSIRLSKSCRDAGLAIGHTPGKLHDSYPPTEYARTILTPL